MDQTAPLIEYAPEAPQPPADALFRGIVGWASIVCAGAALLSLSVHLALALGWAASPAGTRYSLPSGAGAALFAAHRVGDCALLLGGTLVLRRSRLGLTIIRWSVLLAVLLAPLDVLSTIRTFPVVKTYFSTPATAALSTMDYTRGLWVPILIGALTLPPLDKRLV